MARLRLVRGLHENYDNKEIILPMDVEAIDDVPLGAI
jgi:hypothetical protein